MRYLGGKSRIAQKVGGYLNFIRMSGQAYWEPFVGAGWILAQVVGERRYASDLHAGLIALWQALQTGWEPPRDVSEADYEAAKLLQDDNPIKAFIGFGCSFWGKWFSGYARDNWGRNYAANAQGSLLAKIGAVLDTVFFQGDFMEAEPPEDEMLIYCDPPYAGSTEYNGVSAFDSALFWARCAELGERGHTVIVSEYAGIDGFAEVLRIPTRIEMRGKRGREPRVERVFRYGTMGRLQPCLFAGGMDG